MVNNFIGGGQVFLHKVRMFSQVFFRTLHVSLFIGIFFVGWLNWGAMQKVDWHGFYSYRKAVTAIEWDDAFAVLRTSIGNKSEHTTLINARLGHDVWQNVKPEQIIKMRSFQDIDKKAWEFLTKLLWWTCGITLSGFILIFLLWSKFGKGLKDEKKKAGSGTVLTVSEVKSTLRMLSSASSFKIGKMPLVKDMETMNFLVTGSIGSGKTNLMHNLLPQIENKEQPAVVIDNTGEMIAKYYNKERGDIIFNPFDNRSHVWDFWEDCAKSKDLEKFADILVAFNSRKNHRQANDFWEEGAQSIFVDIAKKMQQKSQYSIENLYKILCQTEHKDMYKMLENTNSAKYFAKDNEKVAASIMSVLISNLKPLRFVRDSDENNKFSIEQYLNQINKGGSNWLFLSTDPSARELTIPLNAALLELLISRMRRTRTNSSNKLWIILDELPSLGKLPSLTQLMQEGRKYGSCVLAGLQSTSQLYSHYGDAEASSLIGLFKTKFAFQSDDPRMGELYSKLCGTTTIISQQKNTSFGANEFRDGVSYNEKKANSPLVSYEEFGKLNVGECYTLLPLSSVRLSRMQVPRAQVADKNLWFDEAEEKELVEDRNDKELEVEEINESQRIFEG